MSPELVSILALVVLFVAGTVLPINMGALGFVAAWLVGMYSLGLTEKEIIGGISGDLVLTLVGVTYLFAIARNNGTVDLIVSAAVRSVGGRVALIPWVMFVVTGVLTAIGAASPAACAIIGPIALGFAVHHQHAHEQRADALGFAGRYRISPLLMGMLVVHGAQAGGFSPISIYGAITNSVMAKNKLPVDEITIFLTSLLVNLAIAIVLFVVLGGHRLWSQRLEDIEREPAADGTSGAADAGGGSGGGSGGVTLTKTETRTEAPAASTTRLADQVITLVAFAAVAFVALVFERNIGFTAITAAVLLTAIFPKDQRGAVKQVAWSTVLLVAGVSTFAAVLDKAGAPEAVGIWAASLSTVLIGALILCYVGGITSAFASSTALLPIIIPIAVPLIATGNVSAVAVVAALAIASTIVDVSPFSTNGALMVANRPDTISEEAYYGQVLRYSVIVTAVGPLLMWLAVVVPGWS
jgi:Na+/H+ antiporter NhaD/arsenite permease-like protein